MKQWFPFSKWYYNLLVAVPAFLLGAYFDLTKFRLDPGSALAGSSLFLLASRLLGGLIFTLIVLALLRAAKDLKGLGRVGWKQMLILFLALNAVTALYAFTSRTVYVWDNAGYWAVARSLSRQWLGRSQILEVLKTTISLDYNYLPAWPISLVMRVFGESRAVFLFSISNLYTLPGLWGLCALAKDKKWGGLVLAGIFPMFTYIGFVGFVDVAACTLAIWAYVIYTSDRNAVSRGVFSGTLLVGTFLLRRYFFFFAASFGLAALAVKLIFERKKWADFLALFGTCAVCAVYFTPNFLLEKVLGTNYNDLYSAYDLGLVSDLKLFCRYFGLILLVLLAVWALVRLVRGGPRRELTLCLVQLAACFAAFVSVQSHGQQHLLLYLPGLALLLCSVLPVSPRRWAAFAAAAAVFGWCLVPKEQPASIDAIEGVDLLPSFVFYGPSRGDIDQLVELADYVDSLSAEGEKTAAVLASSLTFNSETLTNLRLSLNLPEPDHKTVIRYQGTVDKRDPFNWNTVTADYLIVGDPVQTHLGEENQQVFALLARDVLAGTGPGSAYRALPETFLLKSNVTVRIYERTRDLTAEEYHLISDRLTALYPDYAEQYAVPEWVE
ncbi:MAG: hypothetical protein ACI4O3_06030 [Oscillospiraceae bacterium]